MNKDNAKQFLPLVQALAEGKTIQIRTQNRWSGREEVWTDMTHTNIQFFTNEPDDYRVKPEEPKEIVEYYLVERLHGNEWRLWSSYTTQSAAMSTCLSLKKDGRPSRWRRFVPEKV